MGYQYDSIRYGARLLAPLAHQELRNITAVHTCYGTPATASIRRMPNLCSLVLAYCQALLVERTALFCVRLFPQYYLLYLLQSSHQV